VQELTIPPKGAPSGDVLHKEQQITQDLNQKPEEPQNQKTYEPQPNEKPDTSFISYNKAITDVGGGDGRPPNYKPTDNDLAKEQHRLNTSFQDRVLKTTLND